MKRVNSVGKELENIPCLVLLVRLSVGHHEQDMHDLLLVIPRIFPLLPFHFQK
jgi:hypothetical protein